MGSRDPIVTHVLFTISTARNSDLYRLEDGHIYPFMLFEGVTNNHSIIKTATQAPLRMHAND